MADICVLYLSRDEKAVEQLVAALRRHWSVFWARDIPTGDWEEVVRSEIVAARAVVAVLSEHAKGEAKAIVKDEMQHAKTNGIPLFPFLIGNAEVPFGFGPLNRTTAIGWQGDPAHAGCIQLKNKLAAIVGWGKTGAPTLDRPRQMTVGKKTVHLPTFAFSLSSHETQLSPKEGVQLVNMLGPDACLLSAYDEWNDYRTDRHVQRDIGALRKSNTLLVLDSGNYEAYRKRDSHWTPRRFWDSAKRVAPDIAFSFDNVDPAGTASKIIASITRAFTADDRALHDRAFALCPIVHLSKRTRDPIQRHAAAVVAGVARYLDPLMVAIPERELGDGIVERFRTVRAIRRKLNELGKYHHLHLLGTGNPLSIIALSCAGADSFDGLEWCRTVADYDKGFLFHFRQFDFFSSARLHRIKDARIRAIVEDADASYVARAVCYNMDYFNDLLRSIHDMVHSGMQEHLLRTLPNIGDQLFQELSA